jgi:hypothetical protein
MLNTSDDNMMRKKKQKVHFLYFFNIVTYYQCFDPYPDSDLVQAPSTLRFVIFFSKEGPLDYMEGAYILVIIIYEANFAHFGCFWQCTVRNTFCSECSSF